MPVDQEPPSPGSTGWRFAVAKRLPRILWEGAKPGELPIQLPAKFAFVVNLKIAKALGLTISRSLLLQADRVVD